MAEDFDFTKINQSSEKLAKTHESTIKHLIKSSANEKTKAKLVANHIKLLKEELKTNKDLKPKEIKAIEAEIKATKNATKTTKDFGAQMKDAGAGLVKSFAKMALDTALAVPKTIMNFMDASTGAADFTSATKEFAGTALHPMHMLAKAIDFNVNNFKTLSQQGAGFGKSVMALRDAAHSANMPIMQFVDLIQQNTQTFAALFGNVDSGMASIQEFAKALRTRTRDELAEFGLNIEETSEFMITQLEIQRVRGGRERLTSATLMDRTVEYAKQLTMLSKLTGVSVTELDKQNRAAAVDGAFQATLAGMAPEQKANMEKMLAAQTALSPAMGQMFKEMVAFGVPITDASKQLSILSNGAIPDAMNSFKRGAIGFEEAIGRVRTSVSLDSPLAKALAQAGLLGSMPGAIEAIQAVAEVIGKQSTNIQELMDQTAKDAKPLVGAKENLQILQTVAERTTTAALRVILNEGGLKKLMEKMSAIADAAGDLDMNKIAKDSLGKLENIYDLLKEKLGSGKEMLFKGEDGKNFIDNITPWDTLNERLLKAEQARNVDSGRGSGVRPLPMYNGSDGFQDFGSGTPAMLHGREAVIPAANASQLAKDIVAMAKPDQITDNITSSSNALDIQALIAIGKGNLEAIQKTNLALNTLVTIGAMTEKNTKTSSRKLDSMGGSLV